MKNDDAWIKKQLKDIETLQKVITAQQSKAEDSLATLKKESALALKKIKDLEVAASGFITPELEEQIKAVSVRARSIDVKVPDDPCP